MRCTSEESARKIGCLRETLECDSSSSSDWSHQSDCRRPAGVLSCCARCTNVIKMIITLAQWIHKQLLQVNEEWNSHLKAYKIIWNHLKSSEIIWNHLKSSEIIRNHSKSFEIIRNHSKSQFEFKMFDPIKSLRIPQFESAEVFSRISVRSYTRESRDFSKFKMKCRRIPTAQTDWSERL